MKIRPLFYLLSISSIVAVSCYTDNKENLYKDFVVEPCDTANAFFAADIHPIFMANCAVSGCHIGPSPTGGLDYSSYDDIKKVADDTRLMFKITAPGNSRMPPPPRAALNSCEIAKIERWISEGSQNN